jgi:hypothetical protein
MKKLLLSLFVVLGFTASGQQSAMAQAADLPKQVDGSDHYIIYDASRNLGPGSFTTYYTFRGNGVYRALLFRHARVNANSRVFVSISETSGTPTTRFIGGARMAVYNVAPFNGGFRAWVEISWNSPLFVRFDVLVDP